MCLGSSNDNKELWESMEWRKKQRDKTQQQNIAEEYEVRNAL